MIYRCKEHSFIATNLTLLLKLTTRQFYGFVQIIYCALPNFFSSSR
jgi:hypothetical protein